MQGFLLNGVFTKKSPSTLHQRGGLKFGFISTGLLGKMPISRRVHQDQISDK